MTRTARSHDWTTALRGMVSLAIGLLASMAFFAFPTRATAQISPGPLAKAHASLEGALNCVKCHGLKRDAMSAQCQACHRDIAWLVDQKRGFHATSEVRGKECASCHPDHAGADFTLVAWPGGAKDRFDHRRAGWALEGGHAELRCEECHATPYRVATSATLSKRTSGAGWVGLETTCVSCHRDDDPHKGALDANCGTCHDSRDWKPAPKFSHDDTDYPLTGKHATVECAGCHESKRLPLRRDAKGTPIPIYSPVPFRTCGDCHEDPHAGRFSNKCAECHSTKSFETTASGGSFNHALTRYPLKGRHARVDCAACHGANLVRQKPAFETCASCHSDPHRGEATLAGTPADCASCHGLDGFSPSTYTVQQHAASPYPLEGRHAQVACVKCHTTPVATRGRGLTPVRGAARLRMAHDRCADCHADAHAGQLATRTDGGACESCHAVAGWAPSTFTVAAHARLRLPLEGRHAEIPCGACHAADRKGLPAPPRGDSLGTAHVAVSLASASCASCHVDPHGGRYAAGGALATTGDCASCHTARSFRPSLVDPAAHQRLGFRLEGAHLAVACVGCHAELAAAPATATLVQAPKGVTSFPAKPGPARACTGCHENPHGAQFVHRTGATCESCHDVKAFAPAPGFDHDRDASFKLAGAHAGVACARCHVRGEVDGVTMTIFRPLSGRCESCHDRRPS